MSKINNTYNQLLNTILEVGYKYPDPNRTGVERLEIPSYTFRHEFKDGFPAISTKKLHYKNVVTELLWFLKGDTNIKYLIDNGCNIWNKDAFKYFQRLGGKATYETFLNNIGNSYNAVISGYTFGDLGPVYGKQWRDFSGIDQIKELIQGLKDKPLGTEHLVSAWNPADKLNMALPPCHYGFQIVVRPLTKIERLEGKNLWHYMIEPSHEQLDNEQCVKYGFELHWNQRSVDTFLGLPYNIASYATLALIIEKLTGYKALAIQGDLKKVHLYDNSIDAVKEQLSRDPNKYDKCKLNFSEAFEGDTLNFRNGLVIILDRIINEFKIEDFQLENYESYPAINVEMKERDE
jgi:thymidylate synthase